MSAEIPTDDPREKDSAKNFPQNAPPPYTDENLDDHTCPLISPLAAHSPQSQPDHYLEIPSCKVVLQIVSNFTMQHIKIRSVVYC